MSSARFMVPATPPGISEGGYPISPSVAGQYSATLQAPPGLGFPPRIASSPALSSVLGHGTGSGPSTNLDMSQTGGSAYASRPDSPTPPPPILSSSDFPALTAEPQSLELEEPQSPVVAENSEDSKALAKAERKAAKKAAAAERAAERQRVAQERATVKAAEKARLAEEKAKAATLKAEQEKVERERLEKERAEKEKAEKERLEKERVVKERLEKEKTEREAAEREKAEKKAEKARVTQLKKLPSTSTPSVSSGSPKTPKASGTPKIKGSESPRSGSPASVKPPAVVKPPSRQLTKDMTSPSSTPVPAGQVPILSRLPKKNKPVAKPIKIPKEEDASADTLSIAPSTTVSEAPRIPLTRVASTAEVSSSNSRSQSGDRTPPNEPASLTELLADIEVQCPWMNISTHPFFDVLKINPAAKMPLEYGPLVHALSALSVGGGSFANNMPSGSIDNAVSSFQQLLETLTQTISDLLRLLPRTTWDDSSSFDGVLRDMLKGDDFLDDGAEDGSGKEDEVAALTLALERRARWMEVQLSKLEELHRDINTAAVRAVLAFNDNGWDHHGFMPRVGNTLQRFDKLGMVEEHGISRSMSVEELEKKLAVAKEAAVFAETEMREAMDRLEDMRPSYDDEL
ncbi:hypothetical protein JAAARDRAFT_192095 [Jaapia argillacea MUCL 33604]|uniref:Uncharacterized protein n=1 Tax=Jaapia argillacea MUCL 33604 TaxID=933084 RepID=A0A067PXN4_9AGAM|nr:hypothetical protein JAAARDRAFT_192095 [Jaapia argillacea MUCL 33604]